MVRACLSTTRASCLAIAHALNGPVKINVVEDDPIACLSRDLRNTRAHLACSDDTDTLHVSNITQNRLLYRFANAQIRPMSFSAMAPTGS